MVSGRSKMSDEEFLLLNEIIASYCGIQFPEARRSILEARLAPRLEELRLRHFFDYYLLLEADTGPEKETLTRLISNNETYFFRAPYHFEALLAAVPSLRRGRREKGPVRVLSAGCSSGEEPYTLALYGQGVVPGCRVGANLAIDAFDIDSSRIEMARRAVYRPSSLRALEAGQQERYFQETDEGPQLRLRFRHGVRFETGNILDPRSYPGKGPYDAVFCRNVLIYFSERALLKAVENFADALRPGGLLFLGHSESIIGMSPLFETVRFERCLAYRRVKP